MDYSDTQYYYGPRVSTPEPYPQTYPQLREHPVQDAPFVAVNPWRPSRRWGHSAHPANEPATLNLRPSLMFRRADPGRRPAADPIRMARPPAHVYNEAAADPECMAGPPVRVYNEAAPSSPHSGEDISHLPAHPILPTVGEGHDAAHGEESRILDRPGRRRILSWYQSSVEPGQSSSLPHACGPDSIPSPPLPLPIPVTYTAKKPNWSLALRDATLVAYSFLLDSFTRQLYLHLLLRIPSLYFSRVASIFEEAQFSLPQIRHMALQEWNSNGMAKGRRMFLAPQNPPVLPRSLLNFRSSWEAFINSLMREWKTLNIISVLLLSAILTMLQLEGAAHPLIRTSALCSLICALMSLLYGCMYIIRFGTMRKLHKASGFATEAQKDTASIWWNVWVLLAMPATWLAWSIIMFLICIMSFIWLSGIELNSNSFWVSPQAALGLRIGLTVVFSLALMYFVLIVKTFHRYGDALDEEWMRTVRGWVKEETLGLREKDPSHGYVPYSRPASWVSLDQDNASRGPSPVARPPLPPSPGQLPLGPEPPMPTQLEPLEPPLRDAIADQVDFFDTGSDPMRLNHLLQPSAISGLPFLRWNMLYSAQHLLDLRFGLWWDGRGEPATFTPATSISIVAEAFPWVIKISARNRKIGVTCGELVDSIYSNMQQLVTQAEYDALPSRKKHRIPRADGVPDGQLPPATRRLDSLGHCTIFGGIRENEALVKRVCGNVQPFTFELVCNPRPEEIWDPDDQDDLAHASGAVTTPEPNEDEVVEVVEVVDDDEGKLRENGEDGDEVRQDSTAVGITGLD